MRRLYTFIIILTCLSGNAMAAESKSSAKSSGGNGLYLDESFFPKLVAKNDTTSFSDSPGAAVENGLGFDTRTTAGYIFGNSWLLGVTYNYYSLSTKRSYRSGGDDGLKESTTNTQMGVTVGWISSNWRILVTSFLSGEKIVDTKNFNASGTTASLKTKNTDMTGYQLMTGYNFPISGAFSIGPTVVYRSLTFAKQSRLNRMNPSGDAYSGKKLYTAYQDSSLDLLFSMTLHF